MTTPYRIVEEYVFHPEGISHVVHGRVTVSVGLNREYWGWDTDFEHGSHKSQHAQSLESARNELFGYIDNLNIKKINKDEYY